MFPFMFPLPKVIGLKEEGKSGKFVSLFGAATFAKTNVFIHVGFWSLQESDEVQPSN